MHTMRGSMNNAAITPSITSRKVRVWPGLRLEICGRNASAQLTPDEALGLASSIIMHAREAIYQEASLHATAIGSPCSSITARANVDCATVSMWHDGLELIATLTSAQADAMARVLRSKAGAMQVSGQIQRFIPSAS